MAVDTDRAACPDSEELASYVDRRLLPHERAALEDHLAGCDDCREILAESTAFAAMDDEAGTGSSNSRPWLRVAALVAAAVVVIVVSGILLMRGPVADGRPELQGLVAALREQPQRPSEGRLTGGFEYAPPPSPIRAEAPVEAPPEVRIAVAAIEREARRRPTVESEQALGVAYLVNGDVDQAIETLERSTRARPEDSRFWSDLAAAYLERGARRASASDFEKAREASQRALALDPRLVEAMFNRAAALEHMGRRDEARAAWSAVSAAASTSPWGREAAERARSLRVTP
jgi:tetratricopeptide (TPR) repeat protein